MGRRDRLGYAMASLMLATSLSSCGGGEMEARILESASCALTIKFRGSTYVGRSLAVLPAEGEPIGTATLPPCDDTPNDGQSDPAEEISLARLPGVSPDVAVLWVGTATVLVREDVDPLPPQVSRLLLPRSCQSADEPIEMRGQWRGILGADGHTELDLLPPYDVDLLVRAASATRYERAFLTVRVPASLGTPLSRKDVRASLLKGGRIEITATCDGAGFVATAVAASPSA